MTLTVAEIARRLKGSLEGNGAVEITGLAGIREAQPGQLTFLAAPRYTAAAAATRAGAVIVGADWRRPCPAALIRVKNPEQAFAEAAAWFAPPEITFPPGIHPTAVIAADARLGRDAHIGPHCVVESGAVIGDRCVLVAACYVGPGASLGNDSRLYPHVSLREYVRIGARAIFHNGVVIGSDGFGYVQDGAARRKIPQTGIVVVGDDVEIGANTTIDRARFGQTRIGNGVKIDNLVQIAHNVVIGDHSVVVAQVGISGSTSIGERTILAGQVGIAGHLVIGSDVVVGAQSGITKDIPAGAFVLGSPAYPREKTAKLFALIAALPELKARIEALEKRLAQREPPSG